MFWMVVKFFTNKTELLMSTWRVASLADDEVFGVAFLSMVDWTIGTGFLPVKDSSVDVVCRWVGEGEEFVCQSQSHKSGEVRGEGLGSK